MEQIFFYVPFGIVISLILIYIISRIPEKRGDKSLIDIPVGETGVIDGKYYRSEASDFGCVGGCAFFDPMNGCSQHKVVCSNPHRIYVEFEPYYDDYDDYNDFEYIKWWEVLILIILLIIPMSIIYISVKISDLKNYITSKINKNGKRKKSSTHGCNE